MKRNAATAAAVLLRRREVPKASTSTSKLGGGDQEAPNKRRRIRSSSASSSSSTGYVVSTSRPSRKIQDSPKQSSPPVESSPEIRRRLVKKQKSSPARDLTNRILEDHVPNSHSSDVPDDFDLPPALKPAEPSQTKQWKPRSRPRALPSHTQLDGGSQFEQTDAGIKEGIPPIVSDATMTGTDSPRSLPRGSSRDRSAEQEGIGDVSLFAAFADYTYGYEDDEIILPPPLKPVEADPLVKQAAAIEEVAHVASEAAAHAKSSKEAISESAGNETIAKSAPAVGSSGRRRFRPAEEPSTPKSASPFVRPKVNTHERSPEQEDILPDSAEPVAPKLSKFFDKSGKRKRSEKFREETPVQEVDVSTSKQSDIKTAIKASGSGRKKDVKGKGKRRIIQSDEEEEEEEQIEPCPICGNKVSLSP